ncbi:hypothetical protein KGF57_004154 [Candida theae]|uniref:Uncharacterized protein n=1 Tax=Candida theae TaxID=1198502 RepID=A0AAD5BBR1_9ASCO|nr:uncharacterized protein KGF57_004154 [Candida theae]KAI5952190.1 hypothetical protein KGF57_004154 [Candida theae]
MAVTTTTTINVTPLHRKFINILNKYLCNGLHNPIVSSAIIITFVAVHLLRSTLLMSPIIAQSSSTTSSSALASVDWEREEYPVNGSINGEPVSYTRDETTAATAAAMTAVFDDYFCDFLSNFVNLVFIYRFVMMNYNNSISISNRNRNKSRQQQATTGSSIFQELSIFIMQLAAATCFMYFYFNQFPRLLQVLASLQLVLPFVILFISSSTSSSKNKSVYKLLKECNNNILPFFITNSFLFINVPFIASSNANTATATTAATTATSVSVSTVFGYFTSDDTLSWFYLLAVYSQKLYLIYQYVIYELISVYEEKEEEEEEEEEQDSKVDLEKGPPIRNKSVPTSSPLQRTDCGSRLMMSVCYMVMIVDLVFMCSY